KAIGFIRCRRIGIWIALGGPGPSRISFQVWRTLVVRPKRIRRSRNGGRPVNWRRRVARPLGGDGGCSAGEADYGNRAYSQNARGPVISHIGLHSALAAYHMNKRRPGHVSSSSNKPPVRPRTSEGGKNRVRRIEPRSPCSH